MILRQNDEITQIKKILLYLSKMQLSCKMTSLKDLSSIVLSFQIFTMRKGLYLYLTMGSLNHLKPGSLDDTRWVGLITITVTKNHSFLYCVWWHVQVLHCQCNLFVYKPRLTYICAGSKFKQRLVNNSKQLIWEILNLKKKTYCVESTGTLWNCTFPLYKSEQRKTTFGLIKKIHVTSTARHRIINGLPVCMTWPNIGKVQFNGTAEDNSRKPRFWIFQ